MLHALSFEDFIVVSCDSDGLDIYKIGDDGNLNYLKQIKEENSRVTMASYNSETKTLAYLD